MSVVTRIDPMDFFPAELTARIFSMLEVDGQGRLKSLWLHWVGKLARLSNAWYSWIVQIMKDAKEAIPLFPPMLGAKEVGGKFTIRFGLRRCVQVRIGAITEYNPVDNRYVVEWLDVQLFDKNGVVLEPRRGRSRTGWMRSSEEREFTENATFGKLWFMRRGSEEMEEAMPHYFVPVLGSVRLQRARARLVAAIRVVIAVDRMYSSARMNPLNFNLNDSD